MYIFNPAAIRTSRTNYILQWRINFINQKAFVIKQNTV